MPAPLKRAAVAAPKKVAAKELRPLPHLSDQVAVSALRHHHAEGSALWLVLAMYRAFAILDRDQMAEVAGMGLNTLQFNILNVLQRSGGPMTMGALASALVVQPTNLSSNVSTLANKGLVRRELNSEDNRSIFAVITAEGHAFLDRVMPEHWDRLELLMADVKKADRLALVQLLKQLTTSIEGAQAALVPRKPEKPEKPEKLVKLEKPKAVKAIKSVKRASGASLAA